MVDKDSNYEIIRDGEHVILRVNYEDSTQFPSLEENPLIMSKTIDKIIEMGDVSVIIFYQKRDYEYDAAQTEILKEIAEVYKSLVKQKQIFSYQTLKVNENCKKFLDNWYSDIQTIIFHLSKATFVMTTVSRVFLRKNI